MSCYIDYVYTLQSFGVYVFFFFFQAEDGIRDLVRSRGLGDVYKRQVLITRSAISPRLAINILLNI